MRCLIPFFSRGSGLWMELPGLEFAQDRLAELASTGLEVLVATDSEALVRWCREGGMSCLAMDAGSCKEVDFLAPGTIAGLRATAEKGYRLVIDIRNPGIGAREVAEALALHASSPGRPLLSMTAFADHPCQFQRFHCIEDTGHVLLPGRALPSFLDVDRLPEGEKGVLHGCRAEAETACRVTKDSLEVTLPAAVFPVVGDAELLLKAIPFSSGELLNNLAFEVQVLPGEDTVISLEAECAGFVWTLTSVGCRSEANWAEPFWQAELPWQIELDNNQSFHCINSLTGARIQGRQMFPELLRPEGSLAVLSDRDVTLLEQEGEAALIERSIPMFIPEHLVARVDDYFDYLAWQVGREALTEVESA